jgi:alcohol dehydrogenase/L-iditol 2-dehydrogenase
MIERKNLSIQGSFSHNWPVWETSISLLRDGKVDLRSLISHELKIGEWENAFKTVESGTGIKVLLSP